MAPTPKASHAAEQAFGTTILDALGELETYGYDGSFRVAGPQEVQCLTCRRTVAAIDVHLEHLIRVEGVSDPADEDAVLGLRCPTCDAKGVLIIAYGTNATGEEAEALRGLEDHRRPSHAGAAARGGHRPTG